MEQKKRLQYLGCIGLILFPILNFYLLEAYTHDGFTEVRPYSQLFNILLFELAAWLLFFLFRKAVWALRVETVLAMALGLVNYYVYTFRSLPLVPWDILSLGTAVSVMDNYDFTPAPRVVAVVIFFAFIIVLEGFCKLTLEKWKWQGSLGAAMALAVFICGFSHVLQQEDFQNRHRMYNKLFTPVFMWQVNGFVLTFVMDLPYLGVEKPAGYNRDEAVQILGEYEKKSDNETHRKEDIMPSIIVVMDEAFSDLGVLGDFTPSEDCMPYFHELQEKGENRVTGNLNVSVCGGNTANTEFEFLTGHTMAFLPQGSIPYQQYIKTETAALPSFLKSLGYETWGMHPYLAGGWDRDKVYPLLGLDHLLFQSDFQPAFYIRNYISDQTCVDKVIEVYENRESPLFLFAVTMQNHGSYSEVYNNFTPHITVDGKNSYSLSSYLSLIKKTDEALSNLIGYFSEETDPVMVVFFGDHQPNDVVAEPVFELNGTTYKTLSEEMTDRRYQVPYLIWTNYEMEREEKDISVNYLAGEVLRRAGLPLPPYFSFLQELKEEYPLISAQRIVNSNGEKVRKQDFSEKLKQYQKLQYYGLFDSHQ